jgi:hypothetical protein
MIHKIKSRSSLIQYYLFCSCCFFFSIHIGQHIFGGFDDLNLKLTCISIAIIIYDDICFFVNSKFTCKGSSKTLEHIGQISSSSTSPWKRVNSKPMMHVLRAKVVIANQGCINFMYYPKLIFFCHCYFFSKFKFRAQSKF